MLCNSNGSEDVPPERKFACQSFIRETPGHQGPLWFLADPSNRGQALDVKAIGYLGQASLWLQITAFHFPEDDSRGILILSLHSLRVTLWGVN